MPAGNGSEIDKRMHHWEGALPPELYIEIRVPGASGSQILKQSAHEGGKFVSPTRRPPLHSVNSPNSHFCYRLSRSQGHSVAGRIMLMKNFNDTIGNRTHDLPACSAVSQPTASLRAFSHFASVQRRKAGIA
jgi:hypothetical protein